MTTTPRAYAATAVTDGSATEWATPSRAQGAPDALTADVASLSSASSSVLLIDPDRTQFADIATLATIVGVTVKVMVRVDSGASGNLQVGLYSKGHLITGATKTKDLATVATTLTEYTFGGAADLWATFLGGGVGTWCKGFSCGGETLGLQVGVKAVTASLANLKVDSVSVEITYTNTAARQRPIPRGTRRYFSSAGPGGAPEYFDVTLQMRGGRQDALTLAGPASFAAMINDLHVQAYAKGSGGGSGVQAFIDGEITTMMADQVTRNTSPNRENPPYWLAGSQFPVAMDLDGTSQPTFWRKVFTIARNLFYREWSFCNVVLGAGVNESNITNAQIQYLFSEWMRCILPIFVNMIQQMQAHSPAAACTYQTCIGDYSTTVAINGDPAHTLLSGLNTFWTQIKADNDVCLPPLYAALDLAMIQFYQARNLVDSVVNSGWEQTFTEAEDLARARMRECNRLAGNANIPTVGFIWGGHPTLSGATGNLHGMPAVVHTPTAKSIASIDASSVGGNDGFTVTTTANHGITGTRLVSIAGSNSTPSANGTWLADFSVLGNPDQLFIIEATQPTSGSQGTLYINAVNEPFSQKEADAIARWCTMEGATILWEFETLNDMVPGAGGNQTVSQWAVDQIQPGRDRLLASARAQGITNETRRVQGRGLARGRAVSTR